MHNNRIDKLYSKREMTKEQAEELELQLAKMGEIARKIFSSPSGVEFMRWVYQYSGIHDCPDEFDINPNVLVAEKVKRQFYMRCFRQFFNTDMIKEIEKT